MIDFYIIVIGVVILEVRGLGITTQSKELTKVVK